MPEMRTTSQHSGCVELTFNNNNNKRNLSKLPLRVAGGEQESAATAGILQGSRNLVSTNKVVELGASFAAQTFLEPSTSRLTDWHFRRASEMRLEGIRAAIHFLAHDDDIYDGWK